MHTVFHSIKKCNRISGNKRQREIGHLKQNKVIECQIFAGITTKWQILGFVIIFVWNSVVRWWSVSNKIQVIWDSFRLDASIAFFSTYLLACLLFECIISNGHNMINLFPFGMFIFFSPSNLFWFQQYYTPPSTQYPTMRSVHFHTKQHYSVMIKLRSGIKVCHWNGNKNRIHVKPKPRWLLWHKSIGKLLEINVCKDAEKYYTFLLNLILKKWSRLLCCLSHSNALVFVPHYSSAKALCGILSKNVKLLHSRGIFNLPHSITFFAQLEQQQQQQLIWEARYNETYSPEKKQIITIKKCFDTYTTQHYCCCCVFFLIFILFSCTYSLVLVWSMRALVNERMMRTWYKTKLLHQQFFVYFKYILANNSTL